MQGGINCSKGFWQDTALAAVPAGVYADARSHLPLCAEVREAATSWNTWLTSVPIETWPDQDPICTY